MKLYSKDAKTNASAKFYTPTVIILFAVTMLSCNTTTNNKIETQTKTQIQLQEWRADKFGMFIHWGLYSLAGGVWGNDMVPFYAEQIMNHARIPAEEYENVLAKNFNPLEWDAEEIVKTAKNAGMKYIVFTSKHHDGFCMFKTATTNYNIVDDTPFGRDAVKELADACAKYDMKLGLYYSLPDWHFKGGIPRLEPDSLTKCWDYVNQVYSPLEIITPELEECIVTQLTELLSNYGDIETIWFDMGLLTPEQSIRFKNVVKSLQPDCLVSGRIMNNQGDYLTLPDNGDVVGYPEVAWDNPASMYGTWGYRQWQGRPPVLSQVHEQLTRLMSTVSHGGVFLLNIGPTGTGKVIEYEKEVLRQIGVWTSKNAEAIYDTKPSPFNKLEGALCTRNDNKLYFTVTDSIMTLVCPTLTVPITKAYLLEDPSRELTMMPSEKGTKITLPPERQGKLYVVVAEVEGDEIQAVPDYIHSSEGTFVLTDENGFTHAAFDAQGYVSTQSDSWKSWNIDVENTGDYDVFAIYTPENDAKSYEFSCGNISLIHVLPGVDRMKQTSYVGKMRLEDGGNIFTLKQASQCYPLEPLGITLHEIILRKSTGK
ncbi:MAG: alpha-L-fucosidase [Bacteroidales bacterium]|nr:alpha-L-fucosidase [Bacteroidales bacterium]